MQTDYLRYFIDVATLGSMTAAAKKNFMTAQGISRSVAALEADLGCQLLQRDSNKVTLTPFGERFLKGARDVIDRENALRRSIVELQSENLKRRHFHFICYSSPIFFDTPLFFPASGLNTAHYGNVQFLQRGTAEVVALLLDAARTTHPDTVIAGGLGLFDLFADENERAIRQLLDAGYEYRPFMHTCDYVLVPVYSSLASAECLSKTEIGAHRLAVSSGGGMERAISRHIGAESVYVSSGDSSYRSHLCKMGEALTFVPGMSLAYGVPEGTVAVPMQEPYTIEVGFVAHGDELRNGVLASAIERLHRFYEKNKVEGSFTLLDGSLESSLFTSAYR